MRTIGAISLPGRRTAPRQARMFVRTVLATAQPALDEETAGDIELCVDELVANAWEHTDSGRGGHILVKVAVDGRMLRTTVVDDGGARTKPCVGTDLTAEHGRGLRLVDGLAARWGVDTAGRGTAVWAEFGHAGRLGAAGRVPDGELSARPGPGLPSRGGAALF
ncbi:MAG TPA: ATP-binding protein [Streptosporangiaceae bacterium]